MSRHAIHPLNGSRIPVIGDAVLVDSELGTGAVKVRAERPYARFAPTLM